MILPKSILALSLTLAPTLVTSLDHFYFGSYSGEGLAGTWGQPGSLPMCYYMMTVGDTSICDGMRCNPDDNSGGCPGQSGDPPNFCNMGLPDLDGVTLNRNGGDCPADDEAADGVWYADAFRDGVKVARCVYEMSDRTNCASTGSFLAHKFIHCYPEA